MKENNDVLINFPVCPFIKGSALFSNPSVKLESESVGERSPCFPLVHIIIQAGTLKLEEASSPPIRSTSPLMAEHAAAHGDKVTRPRIHI